MVFEAKRTAGLGRPPGKEAEGMRTTSHEAAGNLARHKALTGAALLTIAVALAACGTSTHDAQPGPQSSQAAQSSQPAMTAAKGLSSARTGIFAGLNDKHVSGTVSVANGQILLSGFSSDAGPDLHVYLTNGTDESAVAAGQQIASVAFDNASQTFPLNAVDASKYNTVVIHCDKAKAVFGAATLS
jgi:ABC-type oligopeptide transport system substrate-binding subunit